MSRRCVTHACTQMCYTVCDHMFALAHPQIINLWRQTPCLSIRHHTRLRPLRPWTPLPLPPPLPILRLPGHPASHPHRASREPEASPARHRWFSGERPTGGGFRWTSRSWGRASGMSSVSVGWTSAVGEVVCWSHISSFMLHVLSSTPS